MLATITAGANQLIKTIYEILSRTILWAATTDIDT